MSESKGANAVKKTMTEISQEAAKQLEGKLNAIGARNRDIIATTKDGVPMNQYGKTAGRRTGRRLGRQAALPSFAGVKSLQGMSTASTGASKTRGNA
jgi:hypothetical protein